MLPVITDEEFTKINYFQVKLTRYLWVAYIHS